MINLPKLTEPLKQGRAKLWLPVSIVLLLLLAFGLYQQQMNAAGQPQWQKLRIAYAIEPPYAFLDENQRVTGESSESARQIAAMLGVKDIEWLQLPFAELIPALQNRQVDLIAAGMFINRQRQNQVRFSIPTLQVYPGLLVPADSTLRFSSDFQENLTAGRRFVVIEGSVEAAKLANLQPAADYQTVSDLPAAIDKLNHHLSDALLLSLPTLQTLAAGQPQFRVIALDTEVSERLPADYVAFAFNRQDTDLLLAWNQAMQQWLGSEDHLQTISRFGFDQQDIAITNSR